MTNTEGLDNMNFDVLTEIGNIGAGNAVTALSQMINAKVDMYVPQVKMLTFQCDRWRRNIGCGNHAFLRGRH